MACSSLIRSGRAIRTLVALSLVTLAGCNFKTPAPTTPLANSKAEMIPKSFFFKNAGGKTLQKQTFLAGWMPIDSAGPWKELSQVSQAGHLNLDWKITEKAVLGYEINPSFASTDNNARVVVEIPITRHYHYEREKDQYQRETNRYIKNESRDAWMHRPYMDLDLASIRINLNTFSLASQYTPITFDASDIEWDMEKKFLGFTVQAKDPAAINKSQAKFRFNFLAFDSDPRFRKTPYDSKTARLINVLHIMGKTVNGMDNQVMYAGHWKLPVTFYTHGVPPEHMQIVRDVIKEWNKAFERTGVVKKGETALFLDEKPNKYPLDLRRPAINWIADRRDSLGAPLGIGMTAGDVRTGQFRWGGVTMWAGAVEEYINRFMSAAGDGGATTPSGFQAMGGSKKEFTLNGLFDQPELAQLKTLNMNNGGMDMANYLKSPAAMETLKEAIRRNQDPAFQDMLQKSLAEEQNQASPEGNQKLTLAQNQSQILQADQLNGITSLAMNYLDRDLLDTAKATPGIELSNYLKSIAPERLDQVNSCTNTAPASGSQGQCSSATPSAQAIAAEIQSAYANSQVYDTERTMADLAAGLTSVPASAVRDERALVRTLLKDILMHEIGHVLGLGHNFKGNILPEPGTVPEHIYQDLKAQWLKHAQDPTAPEMISTVMDYGHPASNVNASYEEIKPGHYDDMMLKYLYQGQYPTIAIDNPADVKYFTVKEDGKIPDITLSGGKKYKVAFLPECGDYDASLNVDPYCSRFDRGATASEIVQNRFTSLNALLPSLLNAFSGAKGGNAGSREATLWYKAFDEFSRVRIFYDLMRVQLDSAQFPYRDAFAKIRGNSQALYAFSKACLDPSEAPDGFRQDFETLSLRKPDLKRNATIKSLKFEDFTQLRDLCQANLIALSEWQNLLSRKGSDYTTTDILNRYSPTGLRGGETTMDWGYLWGAYKEIGSFPLRFVTLYTVTTPMPVLLWGGIVAVPTYAAAEHRYSYSSLYPREFGSIISTAVRENMTLGGGALESPTEMGSSLLFLDYLLKRNRLLTKDNLNRFPEPYLDNLRGLTSFEITFSPVILTNVTDTTKASYYVFKYKGAYYDLANRESVPIPWVYLLPDRRVIAKGIEKQMFLPLTKFRYLTDTWGYVWAIDVRYQNNSLDDGLKGTNPKVAIDSLYQEQLENCFIGENGTGLSSFFTENGIASNDEKKDSMFSGFEVQEGIAFKRDLQDRFDESLKKEFDKYYTKFQVKTTLGKLESPKREACNNTLNSLGLIISGTALINGYWLPQAAPYMTR